MATAYEVRFDPATRKWQVVDGGDVRFQADSLRTVEDWLDRQENGGGPPEAHGEAGTGPPPERD